MRYSKSLDVVEQMIEDSTHGPSWRGARRQSAAALKIAEARMPDLILLDIMMPAMDGYEVCRRLKSNAKTSAIPVIFVTAQDQAADEAKGLELGAVDYIMKPVDPAALRACIKKQLA